MAVVKLMANRLLVGHNLGLEHHPELVKLLQTLDLVTVDLGYGRELRVLIELVVLGNCIDSIAYQPVHLQPVLVLDSDGFGV